MNRSPIEGRRLRPQPHVRPLPSPDRARKRAGLTGLALAAGLFLGSCSYLERGRQVADFAITSAHHANLAALIEAQEERVRLRKSRCYNPMLTPATIADAALDPRLGAPWVEELLRDCPKFAAFIAQLVVSRTQLAGLMLPPPEAP